MQGWLGAAIHGIFAFFAGAVMTIGVGSTATYQASSPDVNPQMIATTTLLMPTGTSTQSEVEYLQQELDAENAVQQKLQAIISGSQGSKQNASSVQVSLPSVKSTSSITFTTPSGAVLDENGNVISAPAAASQPSVVAGKGVLSASQIVAMAKASVALIETPDDSSFGSGFVIDDGKYILTNRHVVGSNTMMKVILPSGTFTEPVLGTKTDPDLALIFVGDQKPPALILGSSGSGSLSIGDDVYALGFPQGLNQGLPQLTITQGILSTIQNTNLSSFPLLQTDAAINHGNSGGPLLNDQGEVVGINTYTAAAPLSQAQGIYYAIPIDTAESYFSSLSQNGQSRYELHPLGSTMTIPESVLNPMQLNPKVPCTQLGLIPASNVTLCQFYRDYGSQYKWNVTQDLNSGSE